MRVQLFSICIAVGVVFQVMAGDLTVFLSRAGTARDVSEFTKVLPPFDIVATQAAVGVLKSLNLPYKEYDENFDWVGQDTQFVLFDIGDPNAVVPMEAVKANHPGVLRVAYWQNPEIVPPEEYLQVANEMIERVKPNRLIVANAVLANALPISLEPSVELFPLGFINLGDTGVLKVKRFEQQEAYQRAFCAKHDIQYDPKVRYIAVFGEGNQRFADEGAQYLCEEIRERLKNERDLVIVVKPHPSESRYGLNLYEALKQHDLPHTVVYEPDLSVVQLIADVGVYGQTTLVLQNIAIGLPMIQVRKELYPDLGVRSGLVLTDLQLHNLPQLVSLDVEKALHMNDDWPLRLQKALQ